MPRSTHHFRRRLRLQLCVVVATLVSAALFAVDVSSPYRKDSTVPVHSEIDRILAAHWERLGLARPCEASDAVFVRRATLDLCGRLPTSDEARDYVAKQDPDKRRQLIERLVNSEGFIEYWSLHFCDLLRVKSEFPINLWPNAVYGYQRRVQHFLRENEPYDHFVMSLLLATGSNFRVPEVNFYRATANRRAAGLARAAALTFMGARSDQWPEIEQQRLAAFFDCVACKSTKEWKEEIVYLKERDTELVLTRPDGKVVRVPPGADPRQAFYDYLREDGNPYFARALANRVWYWLLGRGIVHEADDLRADNPPLIPELLDALAAALVTSGYDLRYLCRLVASSAAYCSASCPPPEYAQPDLAREHFAVFALRRLPAEVLDDVICDLTGVSSSYSSVIPEPFTYVPPEARTIALADGSISSSFLILFGRPARDDGVLAERNNGINGKQRLYLFNSGDLYRKLGRIGQRDDFKGRPFLQNIPALYWLFYSRPPTRDEYQLLRDEWSLQPGGKARWRFQQDLAWVFINTSEFLYQH